MKNKFTAEDARKNSEQEINRIDIESLLYRIKDYSKSGANQIIIEENHYVSSNDISELERLGFKIDYIRNQMTLQNTIIISW